MNDHGDALLVGALPIRALSNRVLSVGAPFAGAGRQCLCGTPAPEGVSRKTQEA